MPRRLPDGLSSVSDVLAEVFKRGGMKRGVRRAEAVLLWPQVVGPEVSRFTEAKTLQDGTLFVEVTDSETGMHLSFQRQRFMDVYRAKFGVKEVREIRFRVGRSATPEATEPLLDDYQPDPRALARLTKDLSTLDLPDTLTEPTMRAAKAMLGYRARRRAEGWRECPICTTLSPEAGLCVTCARYTHEGRVVEAGHALAVNPDQDTPLLSEDERQVAAYLAVEQLKTRLQELLPQVLAEPTYKPHLAFAARCYLAHRLRKPLAAVGDDDLDRLEPRIARVLGRWH